MTNKTAIPELLQAIRVKLNLTQEQLAAVLQGILNARLRLVSWALGDQSKGGWTAEGNPGERDLVVKRDTAILSVIEAIMVRNPTTQQAVRNNLTSPACV
jgi:hypothetical protein